MSVVCPTSTPRTSVIALFGPGAPSKGPPRSRARGLVCEFAIVVAIAMISKQHRRRKSVIEGSSFQDGKVHAAVYGIEEPLIYNPGVETGLARSRDLNGRRGSLIGGEETT